MLTNVGMLVFDNKNLTKPSRVLPLHHIKLMTDRSRHVDKRDHTFALKLGSEEVVILAAPDRLALQAWCGALKTIIEAIRRKP